MLLCHCLHFFPGVTPTSVDFYYYYFLYSQVHSVWTLGGGYVGLCMQYRTLKIKRVKKQNIKLNIKQNKIIYLIIFWITAKSHIHAHSKNEFTEAIFELSMQMYTLSETNTLPGNHNALHYGFCFCFLGGVLSAWWFQKYSVYVIKLTKWLNREILSGPSP